MVSFLLHTLTILCNSLSSHHDRVVDTFYMISVEIILNNHYYSFVTNVSVLFNSTFKADDPLYFNYILLLCLVFT